MTTVLNVASGALREVFLDVALMQKVPPLDPYRGLAAPPELEYKDQISWIRNYALHNSSVAEVLQQAKVTSWPQMLSKLEHANRARHPKMSEAYIKFRSQDMMVRRLWPDAKFPGEDPDEIYTQIRRKYCSAARKTAREFEEHGLSFVHALTNLHHKYSNQLAEERKDRAYRSELLGRVRILNSTVRGSVKQEDENDEEFVVVEMSDGSDNSEEQEWEKDDWDMTVVMEVMEVVEVEDEVKMVE